MPAVQTTYSGVHAVAFAGLVANMETSVRISRLVQSAAGAALGVPVFQATGVDNGVTVTPGTLFRGITVARDTLYGNTTNVAPDIYYQGATAEIIVKGVVWVITAANVTVGAAAYYDSSGNITPTSSGNTAIPNATFDGSASSGGLVTLRLS